MVDHIKSVTVAHLIPDQSTDQLHVGHSGKKQQRGHGIKIKVHYINYFLLITSQVIEEI